MPREVALMEYCLDNRQHLVCRQLFHTVREFSSKIKDKKLLDRVSQYDTEKKRVKYMVKSHPDYKCN